MPAKHAQNISVKDSFSHVYNKGVEGRAIFKDPQDFEIFIAYLGDYLSTPLDPEESKMTFTVRGRSFRGTPHQPKNYFGKIELLSYRLSPESFHLLLQQKEPGALEGFIRSLCTRYSLYYNKKYQRSGSLFEGPYKSVQINDMPVLLVLSHFLHSPSGKETSHSSYPEYSGKRDTSWISTKTIFSLMAGGDYRNYVEKYKLNPEENELLDSVILENSPLERRNVQSGPANAFETPAYSKPPSRAWEIAGMTAIFFLLFGLGYRNVNVTKAKNVASLPDSQPAVLSESDSAEPVASPKPKITLMVKNVEAGATLPIHSEPNLQSETVGEAKNEELFEFVSINSGWFGVKLADGTTGYIFSDFIEVLDSNYK